MKDAIVRRGHPARRRGLRPQVDRLESRELLYSTLGGRFAHGGRITYSFAPDGTGIGGQPSALFSSMAARGFTTSQWQSAFQKAAAAWAAVADINLAPVADDGSAFGAAGAQQGDARFGDIRIGGSPLAGSVLATAFLPPAFNGGTLAGDIVVNTNQAWRINNDYDLQTVAIHEIGHALGLGHSAIATAAMYGAYNGMKQALTADDVAGIRAVFGARSADAFDAAGGNNTSSAATDLTPYLDAHSRASIASLDITSAADADWFRVTAPAGTTGMLTVTMQSSGLSSLSPKVMLYNGALQGLASAAAANAFGATVSVTVPGVSAGQVFYVKAMAANGGATGVGGYGLQVNFGSTAMAAIAPPNTTVASSPDQGGGSAALAHAGAGEASAGSPAGAQEVLRARPAFVRRWGATTGRLRYPGPTAAPRRRPPWVGRPRVASIPAARSSPG